MKSNQTISTIKGAIMGKELSIAEQNNRGAIGCFGNHMIERGRQLKGQACVLDARVRSVLAQPDEGAATAEYAVVLVAATGFAAVLVALLKSGAIKTLLEALVKKALKVV
jgi:hypothetical protein